MSNYSVFTFSFWSGGLLTIQSAVVLTTVVTTSSHGFSSSVQMKIQAFGL